MILANDAFGEIFLDGEDFLFFVFEHFGDGDSGPQCDGIGNFIGADGRFDDAGCTAEARFEPLEVGLQVEELAVADVLFANDIALLAALFHFFGSAFNGGFDGGNFGDGFLFFFPAALEIFEFLCFLDEFLFEFDASLCIFVRCTLGEHREFETDIADAVADGIACGGHGVEFHADFAGGFVDEIDGFVGEFARRQVALGLIDSGNDAIICNGHAMVDFVELLDAHEHRDGLIDRGFFEGERVEQPIAHRFVLEDFFLLFGTGCRNDQKIAAREIGFEDIDEIDRDVAIREEAGNIKDDAAMDARNVGNEVFKALFECALVFGAAEDAV